MTSFKVTETTANALFAVAQFVSDDKFRENLRHVKLECVINQTTVRITATNGHFLAYAQVIDVDLADYVRLFPNSVCFINGDKLIAAHKATKGRYNISDETSDLLNVAAVADISFPECKQWYDLICTDKVPGEGFAKFGADLLADICKVAKLPGIKHKKHSAPIDLWVRGPAEAAVFGINGSDVEVFGVLMPTR